MTMTETYQDQFLHELKKDRVMSTFFLKNGYQMRGIVVGYDNFVDVLLSDGKQAMIYKHAISTITPFAPVKLA